MGGFTEIRWFEVVYILPRYLNRLCIHHWSDSKLVGAQVGSHSSNHHRSYYRYEPRITSQETDNLLCPSVKKNFGIRIWLLILLEAVHSLRENCDCGIYSISWLGPIMVRQFLCILTIEFTSLILEVIVPLCGFKTIRQLTA